MIKGFTLSPHEMARERLSAMTAAAVRPEEGRNYGLFILFLVLSFSHLFAKSKKESYRKQRISFSVIFFRKSLERDEPRATKSYTYLLFFVVVLQRYVIKCESEKGN
jgi:hypothetical protein